jgi:2-polyprenyl-6-methoxyphenol hydroxylase-like FAD-dependent oxidoreductase
MTDILIAGAGIGGLTAALSLHTAGFRDILIAEAAAELQPAGVGLNILPNAVRELAALGLLDELSSQAVYTEELRLLNRQGTLIWSEPRGAVAGYRWPQLSIHRGVLQKTLLRAVHGRLGADVILTGSRVTGVVQDRTRVTVTIGHAAGRPVSRLSASVVIGADGIHSVVRSALCPAEGEPKWNGWVMWRGIGRARRYLTGKTMVVAGDGQLRIVAYPIAPSARAGILVNWVVAGPANDSQARYGDWDHTSGHDRALRRCADCRFGGWLNVPALIRGTGRIFEYPMVDRDPVPRWTCGRITLLGDAAHPMYPAGSNGATQAIVDARALAFHLAAARDPGQALEAYDRERRPTVTRVQLSNRQMGPEAVINLAHALAPGGFTDIEEVIPRGQLASASRGYAKIGGFDQAAVNRPSPYDARLLPGVAGRAPDDGGTGSDASRWQPVLAGDHA